MTRVFDRLYLGDREDAEMLTLKNPWHISTVISLCQRALEHRNAEIRYVHLPIAHGVPVPGVKLVCLLGAIETHIAAGRVLVHCETGVSRAPAVVAAYLERVGYLSFADSLLFLRHLRGEVRPHPLLIASIRQHLGVSDRA